MAAAAMSVTEQREKIMDFSVPFMYYTQDLIMKKPLSGIKAVDLLQFMTPFENLVWFCFSHLSDHLYRRICIKLLQSLWIQK